MLKEIDDRNIRHRFPLYLDEYVRTYCKDMGRCSVFLDVIFIGAVIRTYYVKIRKNRFSDCVFPLQTRYSISDDGE